MFRTKLDFSNNRQVKQNIKTTTNLSGSTVFGVPFNLLPKGPDLTTSAETETNIVTTSTFVTSGGVTTFTWGIPEMANAEINFLPITPENFDETQNTEPVFYPNTTTTIDGNLVTLSYLGIEFDITPITFVDNGNENYSGELETGTLIRYSAETLDYTGRTIWVDVEGITKTKDLIIAKDGNVNDVWTRINAEGKGSWVPSTGGGASYWASGTGRESIRTIFGNNVASGVNSIATGFQTLASGDNSFSTGFQSESIGTNSHSGGEGSKSTGDNSYAGGYITIASGINSHSEGYLSESGGFASHAQGRYTKSSGDFSHAEGDYSEAIGAVSHAQGGSTLAIGNYSHSQGRNTQAIGLQSFAGGDNSKAVGDNSFVFGVDSEASDDSIIVLGDSITGNTKNTSYVDYFNIKRIMSTPLVNNIGVDANGNITVNTSDERLKENIKPLVGSLEKLKLFEGVKYQWKDKIGGTDLYKLGFIAQQIEEIEPLLVFTNHNSEELYKGIHIDGIIPMLVEAVKELASFITGSSNTYLETQTVLAEDNNIELNYNGTQETSFGGGIKVLHSMGVDLSSELLIDSDGNWTTNNDFKSKHLTIPNFTPLSSEDGSGSVGNVTVDNNYLYVKTYNGWKRTNLETF